MHWFVLLGISVECRVTSHSSLVTYFVVRYILCSSLHAIKDYGLSYEHWVCEIFRDEWSVSLIREDSISIFSVSLSSLTYFSLIASLSSPREMHTHSSDSSEAADCYYTLFPRVCGHSRPFFIPLLIARFRRAPLFLSFSLDSTRLFQPTHFTPPLRADALLIVWYECYVESCDGNLRNSLPTAGCWFIMELMRTGLLPWVSSVGNFGCSLAD